MKQKKRVALYYRVSTADQSITMQQADLRRYAKARGLTLYKEYSDEGVSGTKAKRPALDRLMDDARLTDLQDGDTVFVEGELLAPASDSAAAGTTSYPPFRVTSVKVSGR